MEHSGILAQAGLASVALAAGGLAAGIAVAQAGPGITGLGPVRRAFFPRLAGQGDPGHVALTFDDGPDPAATPKFLELLADRQISATFFLLGQMVARAPGWPPNSTAAGHEVGVHGWEHRYLPPRGPRATYDDIRRATETITRAAGTRPRLFRPPYGVLSGSAVRRRAAAGAGPGPVGGLGPGMDSRRHPRLGLRQPVGPPAWRGHRPAPRLRLHLAARLLAGRAWAPCPGCSTTAPAAGWPSGRWASTAARAPTAPTASPPAAHGRPASASTTGA